MQNDNTRYLLKTYPCLYRDFTWFECGDGWFELLVELSEKLEPLFKDHVPRNPDFPLQVGQVKEKFGGLRFYLESYFPMNEEETLQIEAAIDEAEEKAWVTCETCGEPGKRRDLPWIQVLCEEHFQETLRKRQEYLETLKQRQEGEEQ